MATIETAEGQTLIVEDKHNDQTLYVEARASVEGKTRGVKLEERAFKIYRKGANVHESRPRTRGDLTADAMADLANRVIGYMVAEGHAERRSHVELEDLTVREQSEAKRARPAYVPDFEDGWPEDGTKTEQVIFMLESDTMFSDEEIAAGVGCSRSLVNEVKGGLEDE